MTELIVQSGKHQGRRLRFTDADITIGRDDTCEIRLTSAEVSKQHCRVRIAGGALFVRDLGSSNGTFVNDVRIAEETRLQPGDRLRIGPMLLQVPAVTAKPADVRPGGKKSKPLSEDDIASWLTDETDHGEVSSADTTVIQTSAAPAARSPAPPAGPPAAAAVSAGAHEDEKKFRTIADEAADIIRRWWQVQKDD
jgi:pSer/pThr/pTyr-binding forkhead associated (FHA) protein